jgi:hypothetical protein
MQAGSLAPAADQHEVFVELGLAKIPQFFEPVVPLLGFGAHC